jgi:hypothetical protein
MTKHEHHTAATTGYCEECPTHEAAMLQQHVHNCPVMLGTGACTCDIRREYGLTGFEMQALAVYNGERSHGLVHSPGYSALMARLQDIFDRNAQPMTVALGPGQYDKAKDTVG